MAKRLEEFDVLKGIGILLVVLGHCKISTPLYSIIYSFHMPLFIMVSGFFYYLQAPGAFLKKTFMRLMVPWLFFVGLNILYAVTMNFLSSFDIVRSVTVTLKAIEPLDEGCYFLYRSIWFLIALFLAGNVYNIACHILTKYHKENSPLLDCFAVITYIAGYLLDLPFYLDTALSIILYYHLGSRLRMFLPKLGTGGLWNSPWLSALLFAAIMCIPAWSMMPDVAIKLNQFPWWLPIFEIPVIIALYNIVKWLCSLSSCLPVRKFFVACGKYSICFLGLHRIVMDAFYLLYSRFPIQDVLQTVLYFLVLVPFVLWFSKFLEKHAPVLIGSKRKK